MPPTCAPHLAGQKADAQFKLDSYVLSSLRLERDQHLLSYEDYIQGNVKNDTAGGGALRSVLFIVKV